MANSPPLSHPEPKGHVLWVDDAPGNNLLERKAFEAFGVTFCVALSTVAALGLLRKHQFAAIISDMGREEGRREGYKLLESIRRT